MNEQKDTQKTGINSYGQSDSFALKSMVSKGHYEYVEKKTSKLVTALYMVTDCMSIEDPIKSRLRVLGVQLVSYAYEIQTLSPVGKTEDISRFTSCVGEVISLIEIGSTMGFISPMNMSILKKEFSLLRDECISFETRDSHFSFSLDESMLGVDKNPTEYTSAIKDKRTDGLSLNTSPSLSRLPIFTKKTYQTGSSSGDKNERTKKILDFIKDKKNHSVGQVGISIKDISRHFTDCSEKTIQRELQSLVEGGSIKKIGAKRWSRYVSF